MTLAHAVPYAFGAFSEVSMCVYIYVPFSERHSLSFISLVPTVVLTGSHFLLASVIFYLSVFL